MAQQKAHEVDGWLSRPDHAFPVILVYGTDHGLVSERARQLARNSGADLDDPFSTLRIKADELSGDPGRLVDEAYTVPMFGGKRLLWVSSAGTQKELQTAVAQLLENPPDDSLVLIEAGDLKKSATNLRGLVEKSRTGMALPCYSDDIRRLDQLISEELNNARLSILPDARELLKSVLGGDRLATRSELEKLILYTMGQDHVTMDDITACVGDSASFHVDDAIDDASTGNLEALDQNFERLTSSGQPPFLILAASLRRFSLLQELRIDIDTDRKSIQAVIAGARPPIFFTRRRSIEKALALWSSKAIQRILERIQLSILQTRKNTALEMEITRQTMLAITVQAIKLKKNQ